MDAITMPLSYQEESLNYILENKLIYPVFQPIISLQSGDVLGFEALSRISQEGLFDNVELMFRFAEQSGNVWMLEQLCRQSILKELSKQKEIFDSYHAKLFMNVNPNVLHDAKFQAGFTKEYTRRYGIDTDRITFEVTEREQIENETSFINAIEHYKSQNYQIAIDDVGSAYAGLNRICNLLPEYIKLDISLVRNVYANSTKYALIKGLVEFSVNSGIYLIAEGIETQKELETLIDLGVQYGQGYFLSRPDLVLHSCSAELRDTIRQRSHNAYKSMHPGIDRYQVRNILRPALTVQPNTRIEQVLTYVQENEEVSGICMLESNRVTGILTRENFLKKLSGRYGFSLYAKKEISKIIDRNFLQVDVESSISHVTQLALQREKGNLYDFVVVQENGQYLGIVTIENLLSRTMEINVSAAKSANPLTGLPGNLVIEQVICEHFEKKDACTIYYLDLDNFKAFNDVYGFEKGDEVICILADVLREHSNPNDFVGHVGGDDFVMVRTGYQSSAFADLIRQEFEFRSHKLYNAADKENGYITAPNRHGVVERFPLLSVTIVSMSNEFTPFPGYQDVTSTLSHYKKQAKSSSML